jgi:apolipoprotein N-acyltransferase
MLPSKRLLYEVTLAATTGILLVLSFPKFNLDGLVWIALVPLLSLRAGRVRTFVCAHFAGVIFMSGLFSWIWTVKAYNWTDYTLLQIIYLPLLVSLWAVGVAWLREATGVSAVIVAPSLWVTLEYIRSHLSFLSFPWMLLGASQARHPWLIQIASITGVYGLSFLVVFVNAALSDVVSYRGSWAKGWRCVLRQNATAVRSLAIAALLLVGTIFYGYAVVPNKEVEKQIPVMLVQGNISLEDGGNPENKLPILDKHSELTNSLVGARPYLVVWPESAVMGDPTRDHVLRQRLAGVAQSTNAWLLVGSSVREKFPGRIEHLVEEYNTMVLFSPQGVVSGQYRKMVLVPFGEYEPLRGSFHWPEAVAAQFGNTHRGTEYTVFHAGDIRFGSIVCWETIFPDHVREFVKRGAQFLVSATSEAWFGDTAAPYEMLMMTILRAVENHVAIIRAANTGLSAIIDPYGRILQVIEGQNGKDIFIEGVLYGQTALLSGGTFYTHYGDVFAFVQIFVFAGLALQACLISLNASSFATWRKDKVIGWRFDR